VSQTGDAALASTSVQVAHPRSDFVRIECASCTPGGATLEGCTAGATAICTRVTTVIPPEPAWFAAWMDLDAWYVFLGRNLHIKATRAAQSASIHGMF
jgi:hypothetical protein